MSLPLTAEDHVREVFRILTRYEHGQLVDAHEAQNAILTRLAALAADREPKPDMDAFLYGLTQRMELSQEWRDGIEYARLQYAVLRSDET